MSERAGQRPWVWVVDDSRTDRELARRALASEYDVRVMADGSEVLERLAVKSPPDAIVLDWMMPEVTGPEVVRVLRSPDSNLPQVPVLLLTVQHAPGQIAEGLEAGANDFVTKPFHAEELRARVAALLRTSALLGRAQRAERELVRVLASAPDVLLTIDAGGRITFVNAEAERVLGAPAAQLLGRSLAELIPDFPQRNINLAPGEPLLPLPDVRIGEALYEPSVRVMAGDTAATTTLALRNVSESRQVERRRLDFYSVMAHDLRSPLQAMMLRTELILRGKRGPLASELASDVAAVDRNARGMLAIINDFLELARLEGTGIKISPSELEMGRLVLGAINDLGPLADANRLRVVWEPPASEALVRGDKARLGQVLANLLGNALKFTPRDGEIRVRVVLREGEVVTEVEDNGPGVPQEVLPQVFERFKRARSHLHIGGSGLGLTIVREIVQAHGGRVGVRSEPGQGSTFWFSLPAARREDQGFVERAAAFPD